MKPVIKPNGAKNKADALRRPLSTQTTNVCCFPPTDQELAETMEAALLHPPVPTT